MDKDRVELKVVCIVASQKHPNEFVLVLEELGGKRRIPVVIAPPEAHAIVVQLGKTATPRPLTHDVLCNIAFAYGIHLEEVVIHAHHDNIFFAHLVCNNGDRQVLIDSRTSDAVAIALRLGSPIYTTAEIVDRTGRVLEIASLAQILHHQDPASLYQLLKSMNREELLSELRRAVENEEYERAAEIKNELNKRKQANT